MKTLRELFDAHRGRLVGKIDHFFDDYEQYLAPLRVRGEPVRVLEIGVHGGGSLELWQAYFGEQARVHGLDIDPAARDSCPPGAVVHIGSQDDPALLSQLVDDEGPFDLVVDDGSHLAPHQRVSFECLYPRMSQRGVYICEDSFTSYWPEYGGGLDAPDSFVAYARERVDELHAWWFSDQRLPPSRFTAETAAITFLSGAVVFQRGSRKPPRYVYRHADGAGEMGAAQLQLAARDNLAGD